MTSHEKSLVESTKSVWGLIWRRPGGGGVGVVVLDEIKAITAPSWAWAWAWAELGNTYFLSIYYIYNEYRKC